MNAGLLTLAGTLALGGQPGPLPVPGQGPPGAVAAMPGAMMNVPRPSMGMPIPAPILPAKILAPQGVRVVAFPGSPLARMYDTPTVLAFRPGYAYRLELSNLPNHPGATLYPEIEVRGTLVPKEGLKYWDYPIPLVFSRADIDAALAGSVITKVIYLEDPEKAMPVEVRSDAPVEFPNDSEEAAIKAALNNGRLVAIMRLGAKKPEPMLLAYTAVDGTILLPGEKYLKAPVAPPMFPAYSCPLFDPILGPKLPRGECFADGGDKFNDLGIGPHGKLGGLDPTDVGVEFTINGKRKVTTSNVVCICSPRFMVQRSELTPNGVHVPVNLVANVGATGPAAFHERIAPMADIARVKPNEFDGRNRPMGYVGKVGVGFFIGTNRPVVHAQVSGLKIVGVVVEPEEITAYPGLPLTVTKSVDPAGPVPAGQIVTFTIKYMNTGAKPITDLVVSDSLSGRLEYVTGSQQTDRATNFSALENEAGSVVLRWEVPGTLLPGQSGVVKFKAKVR